MIGYRHTLLGKLKQPFVQFLSSLNLSTEGWPIGMVDSVNGNNPVFNGASCLIGDNNAALLLDLPQNISLTNTDSWEFSLYEFNAIGTGGWAVNRIFLGQQTSSNDYIAKFAGARFVIRLNNTNVFDYTFPQPEFTAGFDNARYTYSHDGSGNYTVKVENITTGQSWQQTQNNTLVYSTFLNRMFNRQATSIFLRNQKYFGLYFDKNNSPLHEWPMCERFQNNGDIAYDVIGTNHAVLAGATNNNSTQDVFDYFNLGFLNTTPRVPIKKDLSAFADGTTLTDSNAIFEPNAFLNTGVTLEQPDEQDLKDADVDNVYFDTGGNAKQTTFAEIETAISTNPTVYGGEVDSGKSIKNITLASVVLTSTILMDGMSMVDTMNLI